MSSSFPYFMVTKAHLLDMSKINSIEKDVEEYIITKNLKNNKKDTDWNKINLWLDEWQPQAIIVGVTQQADGSASPIENEIKKFNIRNGLHQDKTR